MAGCDYANARVRGMKARLLGPTGILELLGRPDLASRLDFLERTDYGPAIAAYLTATPDPLEGAERGLRARLRDDLRAIDRFLRGERQRALFRAILAFEDGWNLKTILRGFARAEPPERILELLSPTPGLDEPALAALIAQRDPRGLVDLLVTWASPYARPLAEALPSHFRRRDPRVLEAALDRFLVAGAAEAARRHGTDGRIVLRFLAIQIDLTNATTLLRGIGEAGSRDAFVPGGRLLTEPRFGSLAMLPALDLRASLARGLRPYLAAGLVATLALGDPFEADQVLRTALRESMRREARAAPLSVAVPLAFILERQAELRRIRLVLRGAAFGIEPDRLLRLVEP